MSQDTQQSNEFKNPYAAGAGTVHQHSTIPGRNGPVPLSASPLLATTGQSQHGPSPYTRVRGQT
jgi:hypothetical protein